MGASVGVARGEYIVACALRFELMIGRFCPISAPEPILKLALSLPLETRATDVINADRLGHNRGLLGIQ